MSKPIFNWSIENMPANQNQWNPTNRTRANYRRSFSMQILLGYIKFETRQHFNNLGIYFLVLTYVLWQNLISKLNFLTLSAH